MPCHGMACHASCPYRTRCLWLWLSTFPTFREVHCAVVYVARCMLRAVQRFYTAPLAGAERRVNQASPWYVSTRLPDQFHVLGRASRSALAGLWASRWILRRTMVGVWCDGCGSKQAAGSLKPALDIHSLVCKSNPPLLVL